jgi:hypothetical protein
MPTVPTAPLSGAQVQSLRMKATATETILELRGRERASDAAAAQPVSELRGLPCPLCQQRVERVLDGADVRVLVGERLVVLMHQH